jgi:hypothetical protein
MCRSFFVSIVYIGGTRRCRRAWLSLRAAFGVAASQFSNRVCVATTSAPDKILLTTRRATIRVERRASGFTLWTVAAVILRAAAVVALPFVVEKRLIGHHGDFSVKVASIFEAVAVNGDKSEHETTDEGHDDHEGDCEVCVVLEHGVCSCRLV